MTSTTAVLDGISLGSFVGDALNLGGSIPILGDVGKAVKLGGLGIGFLSLVTKGGRHADNLHDAARAWYRPLRGTMTGTDSLVYHHGKHVVGELGSNPLRLGTTYAEYTRDAQKLFRFFGNSPLVQRMKLYADGTDAIKIDVGRGLPGGIFKPDGRIVSFWYVGLY